MKKPRYILRKVRKHKNSAGKWKFKKKRYRYKNIKHITFDVVSNPGHYDTGPSMYDALFWN